MRLNRLDLIRYGRFEDAQIVFPRHSDGTPDLTIVFGPNEAGKSTAFHGFLELLFGFRGGSHPYDFRFNRSDLLVGAELDLPGRGVTVLRRNSKRSQSLLDAQDRPVNETVLSGALHGLTRESYEERFSLNEKSLRDGGERIAKAQGDLGQLLHAGLSGMTGMAQALDAMVERADRFHKNRGRGTILKSGKNRLKELGLELRADLLTSEKERGLRRARDRTGKAFDDATAAKRQGHNRQAAALAAQAWFDQTSAMDRFTETLAGFPDGPDLPHGTSERVAGLVEKIAAQKTRIAEEEEEISKADQAITENEADPLASRLKVELDQLDQTIIDGAPLIVRAATAQADLSRRIEDQKGFASEIDTLLTDLRVPVALLSAFSRKTLDLKQLESAVSACKVATVARDAAQQVVSSARARQSDAPAEPQDLTLLQTAFENWKGVSDLSRPEMKQDDALARLNKVTAALPGSWRDLVDVGLPARQTLEEIAQEQVSLAAGLASAQKDLDTRAAEYAEAQAGLAALEATPETTDIAAIEVTRRKRDLAWQQHRQGLTKGSADQFKTAMYADDGARAHYLIGAGARQRLLTEQGQVGAAKTRHDKAKADHGEQIKRRDDLLARCSELAIALGLDERTPASAFATRHQALSDAADAAAEFLNAQDALKTGRAHAQTAYDALADAARAVGLGAAKGDLPALARRALTLQDSQRTAWQQWQDGNKAIAEQDSAYENCRTDCTEAYRKLDLLTAALPLPDRTPEGISTALPHLHQLQSVQDQHQKMSERVEALEKAITAVEHGAQLIVAIMGECEDAKDPLRVISIARTRVSTALDAETKRASAVGRRDDADRNRRKSEADLQTANDELAGCFAGQGGQDMPPRDRIETLAERDRLRKGKTAADSVRHKAREGVNADLFAQELERLPDATRASELEDAVSDAQTARDTARDAQREADRLYREAFEATDRSDLATERATLLEELRSGARQAAVARLGVLAARGALRRLAAERRSSMVQDVEEAFVTMTAPAWTGVDVWSHAEGEKLVGIQPDGRAVPVEHMSTGTMGQLYFALRLAGYRSFARDPGPLPMILDDIMETFDDARARAALQICAEIGTNGQAILFTHHAHLVGMAQRHVPGVEIVEMPERAG